MVSNAKEDLPLPDSPVITTNLSLGIETSMFFKLCDLAPLISILLSTSFMLQIYNFMILNVTK